MFDVRRHSWPIRKEILIDLPPARVWEALRDVGALHKRLVPGFVTDTRMEGRTRVVTFGNGTIAREDIVSIDAIQVVRDDLGPRRRE
jgi:uncharacterized protein YndB with AHSA1/START domain